MNKRLSCVFVALVCLPALAHAEIADDPQGTDGTITWIQWWETNRDIYIRKAGASRALTAAPTSRPAIEQVTPVLLKATESQFRDLRAEAALALGRIGQGRSRLLELTKDTDARVRCRALVALGLLQDEQELLRQKDLADAETLAVMAGLTLLDKPSPDALKLVRESIKSGKIPELQRMAVCALRSFHARDLVKDASDNQLLLDALRQTRSVALAAEIISSLGAIGGRDNLAALTDLAARGDESLSLPAFQAAMAKSEPEFRLGAEGVQRMRGAACLALSQLDEKPPAVPSVRTGGGADQDLLRAKNVLSKNAFSLATEMVAQRTGNRFNAPTMFYPGLSVLALAKLGDAKTVIDILESRWTTKVAVDPKAAPRTPAQPTYEDSASVKFLPQRGYAAIALGLSGANDPLLLNRARLAGEPRNLRAACVLAVGLSGNRSNGDGLIQLAKTLNPDSDGLICGHIILTLGLLQDPRGVELANLYFKPNVKTIDAKKILNSKFEQSICLVAPAQAPMISQMDATLGTRAAMLGLALLKDPRAASAMYGSWGSDPSSTLEASRAMGACGVLDGLGAMIEWIEQTEKKNTAAWAARCVGEMLDPQIPSRLSRLIEGNCYFQPVQWTEAVFAQKHEVSTIEREFHGLANPMLYWQMLPLHNGRAIGPWSH